METYPQIKSKIERIKIRVLVEQSMPPSDALSQTLKAELSRWIVNGAPEFTEDIEDD